MRRPHILMFDTGLGGLSVLKAHLALLPPAHYTYFADTAGFPYGERHDDTIITRTVSAIEALISHEQHKQSTPDICVIACNTASTLVLPHLRARFSLPFVGTVPAIKPAAAQSTSKIIGVLATPGTVSRDYTRDLINTFASDCDVVLTPAVRLASLSETLVTGGCVAPESLYEQIAPAFVEKNNRRTDTVVLACTHYPLILEALKQAAPWPVHWLDAAPAIAQRTLSLLEQTETRAQSDNTINPTLSLVSSSRCTWPPPDFINTLTPAMCLKSPCVLDKEL